VVVIDNASHLVFIEFGQEINPLVAGLEIVEKVYGLHI
jgi:hypothetical protein